MPGQTITLRAATEEILPGFMGTIQLLCNPANVDLRRLRGGQLRLLVDHDETKPVGMVTRLQAGNGEVVGEAELIETPNTRAAIADVNAGLKSGLSFCFLVHKTRLLKPGDTRYNADSLDMVIERWEPYENSAVATPRGVRSRITGGLLGAPERDADAASVDTETATETAGRPKTAATKRPRRRVDAGLERERSPAPPPPLPRRAVTESDYVTALIRERKDTMTAALDRLTAAPAIGTPPPDDTPDTASPLARLIQIAASPATPQVHHQAGGLELHMDGGRGWARLPLRTALQPAPAMRSAFDTTNANGAIGEQAAGEIRPVVEDEAIAAVLGGVTTIEGLTGDALPAELTDGQALSAWVAEGAAAVYPDAVLADLGVALKPKVARASSAYSLQLAVLGGQRFELAIEQHLRRALRARVVQGILTGTGLDHQPRGILTTPGVAAVEYQPVERGQLDGFFNAEDELDGAPTISRFWLVATDLYHRARRVQTNIGQGGDRRVIDAQREGPRVGGESLAYATDVLADGVAVYGEWSDAALFSWASALLIIDKVTTPGLVKVALLGYVNCHARPTSFAILKPA